MTAGACQTLFSDLPVALPAHHIIIPFRTRLANLGTNPTKNIYVYVPIRHRLVYPAKDISVDPTYHDVGRDDDFSPTERSVLVVCYEIAEDDEHPYLHHKVQQHPNSWHLTVAAGLRKQSRGNKLPPEKW